MKVSRSETGSSFNGAREVGLEMARASSAREGQVSPPPLVSIVLPIYNGSRFLRESIESCLAQTYRNIELIVVDDGSTDDSVEIVRSFRDDRLRLLRHGRNRRTPAALNTGFADSRGAYLTWTSHDNYYAPAAISEMVGFLERNRDVDFVFANQYDIDEAGNVIGERKPGPFEKLVEWCCGSGAFLYRRRVYETVGGYDERAFPAEDYDYWLRVAERFRLGHLDQFLYYSRVHPGQVTNRFALKIVEADLAVKRRVLGRRFWTNRMDLHRAHIWAGWRLCFERDHRMAAARALMWGVAFHPLCLFEYRVLRLLAAVCLGKRGFEFLRRAKRSLEFRNGRGG
jgi:glycosyltransferase involved in cell wall biosynthesis